MMRTKFFESGLLTSMVGRVVIGCGLVAVMLFGGGPLAFGQEAEEKSVAGQPYFLFPHTGERRPVTEGDRERWARALNSGMVSHVTGGGEGKGLDEGGFDFVISYEDPIGVGFNDFAEGEARRARLEETLGAVGDTLNLSGTIDILIVESLNEPNNRLLAFAGPMIDPSLSYTNGDAFERLMTGIDREPGVPEMQIGFNFGRPWYAGTGATPSGQFDMIAVLLHEVTHALGFLNLSDQFGNTFGNLSVFDTFLIRGSDAEPIFGGIPPAILLPPSVLTSNDVTFNGDAAFDGYGLGVPPPIYAPSPYNGGSSISHWDTNTINALYGGAVMTHAVAPGPAHREFTPLDLGAMKDLGYDTTIGPLRFRGDSLRNFQAVATREEPSFEGGPPGDPVVVLTWENPGHPDEGAAPVVETLTLLRSVRDFATEATEETILVVGDADFESYVDHVGSDFSEGTDIFYTVIADLGEALKSQKAFARARVGDAVPAPLVEAFGEDSDAGAVGDTLSFSQLLFTPIGSPVGTLGSASGEAAGANGYEATLTPQVFELPVARNDADGNSIQVPMTDDGLVSISLGANRFTFFGEEYSILYFGANGYVGFESVYPGSYLNFPTEQFPFDLGLEPFESHFEIPRISYLFTDLGPMIGGEIWMRRMADRVVITHENVPSVGFFEFPRFNTVQAELFLSGHIRVTYLELQTLDDVIVGLSEGNGIPLDPADDNPGLVSTPTTLGIDELSDASVALSIAPIGTQRVSAGEVVEFAVFAAWGLEGAVTLTAEWDGPGGAPFAGAGDGTGTFFWRTSILDAGAYAVRIRASAGEEEAFQDVTVIVGFVPLMPTADNLEIDSDGFIGVSNVVDTTSMLEASYTYDHPADTAEGQSFITWFKNGQFVPGLRDSRRVPASVTASGDRWHFRVTPVSASFEMGMEFVSSEVVIDGGPRIESVSPDSGTSFGGTTVVLAGMRLSGPLSVTFGGVEARSVRAIDSSTIEVVTPFFNVSNDEVSGTQAVPIEVVTVDGRGMASETFTFVDGVPIVGAVTPNAGPFEGRTEVVITGTLLSGVTEVLFGGIPALSFSVQGDGTQITAFTPALPDDREDTSVPRVVVPVNVVVHAPQGLGERFDGFNFGGTPTADLNLDGKVDAVDVQIVINGVLEAGVSKSEFSADANGDGAVNASDVQLVVNAALRR